MESRVSVYGIANGAWHQRRCIPCGSIPYDYYAINSIPQQVVDSIHAFGVRNTWLFLFSKMHFFSLAEQDNE